MILHDIQHAATVLAFVSAILSVITSDRWRERVAWGCVVVWSLSALFAS